MRHRKALGVLGVLVVGLLVAGLSFGPIVRARVESRAARYGATVQIERVRPLWLGVQLDGLEIRLADVPSARVHLDQVLVKLAIDGSTEEVAIQGGNCQAAESIEQLQAQAKALLSRLPKGDDKGKAPTPLRLSGVSASWHHQDESVVASGVAVERGVDGWKLGAARLEARRPQQSAQIEEGSLEIRRSDSGGRLLGWKAQLLALEVHLDDASEGQAQPAGPKQPPPEAPARLEQRVAALKSRSHKAAQAALLALAEGSSAEVHQLKLAIFRGKEVLHVGPGALSLRASSDSLSVSLAPSQTAEGGAPLLLSADVPIDASKELALRVSGGPVTLGMLGIHEGDMGLLDVTKATVEAGGFVKISGKADQVEADLQGVFRGLSLEHPKLSTEPVRGIDLRFALVGGAALDGSMLRVDRGDLDVGKVHGEVSGVFEKQGSATTIQGKFAVPLASCQSMMEALPAGLAPKLAGMKMGGTFATHGKVQFDSRRPDSAVVEFRLLNDCRVVHAPPEVNVARFRQPFRRKVYGPDNKLVEVESGPGTPGWVSMAGITPHMEAAVLTTEDGRFRFHRGFDVEAIQNSIRENLKAGRFVRGASTISMQTAKNLYLTRDKTLGRKLQEAVFTSYLEQELSKESLLELYLNSIEYGPMIYGIGPASQHYFHTTAAELSLGQALYLASILPNPKKQHFGPDGKVTAPFMGYLHRLMRNMAKRNLIRPDELEEGLGEWVVFGQPHPPKTERALDDEGLDNPRGEPLPARREEIAQELSASFGLDASVHLDPVVEPRIFEHREAAAHRPRLGIVGPEDQARHTRPKCCASAHQAGFEGADQGAVVEVPAAQDPSPRFQRQQLGVSCGVGVALALVVSRRQELAVGAKEQGADRDIAVFGSLAGLVEGVSHAGGPGLDGRAS